MNEENLKLNLENTTAFMSILKVSMFRHSSWKFSEKSGVCFSIWFVLMDSISQKVVYKFLQKNWKDENKKERQEEQNSRFELISVENLGKKGNSMK